MMIIGDAEMSTPVFSAGHNRDCARRCHDRRRRPHPDQNDSRRRLNAGAEDQFPEILVKREHDAVLLSRQREYPRVCCARANIPRPHHIVAGGSKGDDCVEEHFFIREQPEHDQADNG